MSNLHAIPAGGATLIDPQRTTAVLSIRSEIDVLLGYFHDELDEWMSRREHYEVTIQDARSKLVAAVQRVNALEQLGPPSHDARNHLLGEQAAGA